MPNPNISSTMSNLACALRVEFVLAGLAIGGLGGCGPSYSPNSYASNAAQQAAKVDQAIVVGVRPVTISADSTLGTTTGGAAGGIAGSQVGAGAVGALGALGGTVTGGVIGNVASHAVGDTDGYEYIVRKPNGDLMSVTQRDVAPLEIGAHVLIIQGPQARIVLDYTVPVPTGGAGLPAKEPPAKAEPGSVQATVTPASPAPTAAIPSDGAPNSPSGSAPPASTQPAASPGVSATVVPQGQPATEAPSQDKPTAPPEAKPPAQSPASAPSGEQHSSDGSATSASSADRGA